MRVQVDRDADLLAERGDELLGRIGLEQARHILDGQHVGAAALQLFGHLHIIFEGVLVVFGIEDVAGVADGRLEDLVLVEDFVHGDGHALYPVERVKNAKDVNSALGRCFDELADQVVWIVRVSDRIGAAQQHLQKEVGRFFADDVQTLPGRFMQEAIADVKGRAAPALQ